MINYSSNELLKLLENYQNKMIAGESCVPEEIQDAFSHIKEAAIAQTEEVEKLKKSKELLVNITDNMFDLVSLTDTQGNFLFVGKSHKILGYNLKSLIGKNVMEYVHPDDLPFIQAAHAQFSKNPKKKIKAEYRYRKADGTYIWLETKGKAINNGEHFIFSSRDINQRKLAEEAQKAGEEKLARQKAYTESILAAIPDLMFILSRDGKFLDLKSGHNKDLYLPPEKFLGKKTDEVLPPYIAKMFSDSIKKVTREKTIAAFEYQMVINNQPLNFEARISPLDHEKVIGLVRDMSREKQAERASIVASRRLNQLAEQSRTVHWETDINGRFTFISGVVKKILGYTPEEITGKKYFYDLFPEKEQGTIKTAALKILRDKKPFVNLENKLQTKNGEEVWALTNGIPMFDEKGELKGYQGTDTDITRQKLLQLELENAKEKLELSLESGYIAWWIWDYESGIVQADRKKAEMLGYTTEEFPQNVYEIIKMVHPEDYEPMMQSMRDLLNGVSDKYMIDYRIKAKSGDWKWFFDRGSIVEYTKEGKPKKISGVVIDITDRKNADAEIKKLAALQQILINLASEYINLNVDKIKSGIHRSLEKLGRFVGADRAFIFEYDRENEVANNTYEWCSPGTSSQKEALQNIPYSAIPWLFETHIRGEIIKIPNVGSLPEKAEVRKILESQQIKSLITIPMMDGEECLGFVGFDSVSSYHNYTEDEKKLLLVFAQILVNLQKRSKTEISLLREKEKANAANKAKSEFLANMSHEIRTPMNSILGFSEIMFQTISDPEQKNYLKTILNSGKTLLALINDILDLSKIESRKIELSPGPANLKQLLNEMKELFHPAIMEKNIRFILEVDEKLPGSIRIDEVRLKQILLNLTGNAVKFTHKGFVKISARLLKTLRDKIDIEIAVTDTGIGIHEKNRQRIFESFSQQSALNTRKYGGTGLGLAISKKLSELMNGTIDVQSTPGEGSCFTLTFKNINYSDEIIEEETLHSGDGENITFMGSKILIVDDVHHNRQLVLTYLRKYNLKLYVAENGEMAMEMAGAILPDLILMDIRMPVLDGYEATQQLKNADKTAHIPVVALTASAMKSEIGKLNQFFDGYLRKPVNKQSLVNEMIKHIPFNNTEKPQTGPEKIIEKEPPQNGNLLSQKQKTAFKNNFAAKIADLSSMIIIDDLNELIGQLNRFAQNHQISSLINETKKLEQAVESFDVEQIRIHLNAIRKIFD